MKPQIFIDKHRFIIDLSNLSERIYEHLWQKLSEIF